MFKRKNNDQHDFEIIKELKNSECPIKLLKCKICGKEYWLFNDKWLHAKPEVSTSIEEAMFLSKVGDLQPKKGKGR